MALPKSVYDAVSGALRNVDVSASEAAVFLALLQSSDALRVTDIAKKTKLNRTTAYGLVKSLAKKGLLSSVEENGILRYRSIQPHLLTDYIERHKEKLAADMKRVKDALPLINAERIKRVRTYPAVQYFEGVEGIKQAYEDTIRNNKGKALYGFMGTDAIVKLMEPPWPSYYIGQRVEHGVRAYTVAIDTPSSRQYKKFDEQQLRVIKLLPPGYDFEIELAAYDDKVLITSFSQDHPLSVMIEDEKIAQLMVQLFKYIDSTLSR